MKRRQKITEFFFNEQDGIAEVYTHNTDLKKRLMQYAKAYPQLCQLTEADEDGGMRFEIDKHRISIRLTAPYSEERKSAAKKRGKESGFGKKRKESRPTEEIPDLHGDPAKANGLCGERRSTGTGGVF